MLLFPYLIPGTDWIPFAEMPDLRNIALTGDEADESKYLALKQFDRMPDNAITGNDALVRAPEGYERRTGGLGMGKSSFKPVYD